MANIGDGLNSVAIEQDPSVAQIQAAQFGAQSAQQQVSLPATGFVADINGQDGAITIQSGTSSPGVTVVVTNGLGTISIGVTGFGALATIKCNFTAIIAPTVTDDSGAGYAAGSSWVDTVGQQAYVCISAASGAALWKQTTV